MLQKSIYFIIMILCINSAAYGQNAEKITTTNVENYIQLQKDLGVKENKEYTKLIAEMFTTDIVKNTDGHNIAKGYRGLEKHFTEIRNMYGSWFVVIKNQTLSPNKTSATIRYEIATEKAGTFEVVAILKFSEDQKIKEIDESYYQVEVDQQD